MHPTARALRLADEQLGVVTRRQLVAVGLSDGQVRRLLSMGSLLTMLSGVYRTAGSTASFEQRCLAASFACGDGAVVSHHAAAALRNLVPEPDAVAITVPERRRVRRPGLDVHRSDVLDPPDVSMCGPVPATSPARTLLDIAPSLDDAPLELVTDDAFRRRQLTPRGLVVYLDRPSLANKRGVARLRRIGADRAEHGVPESKLETPMLQIITSYRLPQPVRQHRVTIFGHKVRFDLAYPDERIAIEPEGWAPHWGRLRWQSDHDRYNAIELGEWRVLRFTYQDVIDRPGYVAFAIAEKLGLRPTGWKSKKRPARC